MPIHTISEHEDDVWAVAFSPDGKMLASGGGDTVSLWDVDTAESLQTFRRPIDREGPVDAPEELTRGRAYRPSRKCYKYCF